MGIFNLGKPTMQPQQRVVTPVEDVLKMRQQGFTNNQIVQALQRNGYKTHQIFDAMNQADLRSAGPIDGAVPPELAQQPAEGQMEQEIPDLPGQEQAQGQEQYQPREALREGPSREEERIEEVAEAIIDEKWEDLVKNLNKLLEWKESMENRLAAVETQFKELKGSFENLQNGVIGKVAEYDKSMKAVGTDVKAMDAVFRKVLPTLTESVNELSRLSKKPKEHSK